MSNFPLPSLQRSVRRLREGVGGRPLHVGTVCDMYSTLARAGYTLCYDRDGPDRDARLSLFRICALFACSFVFPPASSGGVIFLRLFMIKPLIYICIYLLLACFSP